MPIYEYRCKNCGHQLEAIQGFNDKPLRQCPECKKPKLEKQISAPAFHLKGTGWYVTDFKGKNKAANDADESGGSETSTEKKAEKKPEKSDTKTSKAKEKKPESK